MARRDYQESLEKLRADVETMGELVLSRLDKALYALEHADAEAARSVIEGDAEINEQYLDLESVCIDLFALQQPVAGDLRFIAASFKIITDLERIGDLAANIGEYALAADEEWTADEELFEIGSAARDLVADALDAYVTGNAEACYRIEARDDQIDARCQSVGERVVRELVEQNGAEENESAWDTEAVLEDVSRVLLTVRDLERVADHGVNITARTLYLVEANPELID